MRSPFARLSTIASRTILTASSASLATSCGNCAARRSISSDLVMGSIPRSTAGLVVELGLQQCAEVGRSRARSGFFRAHPLHRFGLVGVVLRLDRQVDAAVLAIDVDDHRVDAVAFLQPRTDVLDAVTRYFRCPQIALDVAAERYHGPLRIEALHVAGDDAALVVHGDEVRERIAFELLDAERDALA